MVLNDVHKLVGLDERQVALSAFEDALELVNSKDRPKHITDTMASISDVVYEIGDRLGMHITPDVRHLATLVWLTAELFPQNAMTLAHEQLNNQAEE